MLRLACRRSVFGNRLSSATTPFSLSLRTLTKAPRLHIVGGTSQSAYSWQNLAVIPPKHCICVRGFSTSHKAVFAQLERSVLAAFERLLSKVPKGFEDFYDEEEKKSGPKKVYSVKRKGARGNKEGADVEPEKPGFGMGGDGDKKRSGGRNNRKKKPEGEEYSISLVGLVGVSAIIYLLLRTLSSDDNGREITFQEFKTNYLETGKCHKLTITKNNSRCNIYLKGSEETPSHYFMVGNVDSLERQLDDAQFDANIHPHNFVPLQYVKETDLMGQLVRLAPHLAILGVWVFIMYKMSGGMGGIGGGGKGGRNIFSIGKSPAQLVKAEEGTKVTFKDVAGLDEAKVEVMEFVQFLKDPSRFTKLGAKIPKGALLVGPPGTGKTLLAKAVAGEASVPFYSISGSDFIEMFVGVGPSRVRDLFEKAREDTPCIIFIDEIDAVGRARSQGGFSGGNDERENTLNQLLVEMDGFQSSEGVVVLAGTNRVDILDQALLRPGRFDRQINIDKPDIKGRTQIFGVHLKKLKLNVEVEFLKKRLAALTPGFSGADIANICNEAALIAARHEKEGIELVDFEQAVDRVIGGLEKPNSIMSPEEKKLVAYHEAGHAVAGWFLEHADPLLKVTIVPRGKGALGFAQYLPKELSLYQTEQLMDMICMALGGRVAEELFFGKISTGASDDLKKVTNIAYGQVTVYGMSERLGNVSYQPDEGDSQFTKPYSEATARVIDEEVNKLVTNCYNRTMALLEEHKRHVESLAKALLEHETINHDIIVSILGPRQYSSPAYDEFVANARTTKQSPPESEEEMQEAEEAAVEDAPKNK